MIVDDDGERLDVLSEYLEMVVENAEVRSFTAYTDPELTALLEDRRPAAMICDNDIGPEKGAGTRFIEGMDKTGETLIIFSSGIAGAKTPEGAVAIPKGVKASLFKEAIDNFIAQKGVGSAVDPNLGQSDMPGMPGREKGAQLG